MNAPRLHSNQLATPIGPTLTSELCFYCPPCFRPKPLVISLLSPVHPSHGCQLSLLGTKATLFLFKNHKDSLSSSATGDPQSGTNALPSSYLASRNDFILCHFLTFSSFGPLLTRPHAEAALFPPPQLLHLLKWCPFLKSTPCLSLPEPSWVSPLSHEHCPHLAFLPERRLRSGLTSLQAWLGGCRGQCGSGERVQAKTGGSSGGDGRR